MPTIEQLTGQGEGIIAKTDLDIDRADDEDYEDLDETLTERLIGLTEMFPEGLRSLTSSFLSITINGAQAAYSVGRAGLWVAASSATILALPVMFEMERAQMEEQYKQERNQVLLGPNASVSGGQGMMPAMMPPRPS